MLPRRITKKVVVANGVNVVVVDGAVVEAVAVAVVAVDIQRSKVTATHLVSSVK